MTITNGYKWQNYQRKNKIYSTFLHIVHTYLKFNSTTKYTNHISK